MTNQKPRLARTADGAAHVNRSAQWVRRRIDSGQLTRYQSGHDGRVFLVDLNELDELVKPRPVD